MMVHAADPSNVVALLAEGVGRNPSVAGKDDAKEESPSSRRAWVEMGQPPCCSAGPAVALLAEGVGRNG